MKISVFGTGSWGTALAHHAARAGHDVLTWALEPEVAEGVTTEHRNPLFLPDLELASGIRSSTDLEGVAAHADIWLWVVPVQHSRRLMEALSGSLRSSVVIVSASKGIETDTLERAKDPVTSIISCLPKIQAIPGR